MRAASADGGVLWSQWFDIYNFWDWSEKEEEVTGVGLRESVASVTKMIEKEAERLGGQWDEVVLLGISQGGAVGMHTLLNLSISSKADQTDIGKLRDEGKDNNSEPEGGSVPNRLGAFVAFSSRLPYVGRSLSDMRKALALGSTPDDTVFRNTPVLMEHCADDQTVKFQYGVAARDALESFGARVEWKEYWDGGHWFKSPEGIEDAVEFIRKHVPGLEAEKKL